MKTFKNYIVESVRELHHVTWPTQKQLITLTGIVIGFIVASSALIGVIDWLLSYLYTTLLSLV